VLLGRERERRELDRLLATARSGRSATLALVGEPGIGKSALLEYAAEQAGSLRVLTARGVQAEANVPFAALFELLRPALDLLARIPRPQALALEGALALRPGSASDRFAVGAGTLSLLAAYADEAPALLLIDDAHLLDPSSAEALLFALRRLLAEPLAVVLAARAEERSLLDGADVPALEVGGLDRESAAALLGPVVGEAAERLYRATAGNPLALLELRDYAGELETPPLDTPVRVPATVAEAFLRRARDLDDPTRRLLVLASADDLLDVPALERSAALLELDLTGLDAAQRAGLIRVSGTRIEFRHPLARAALYGDATPEQRREAHRALASTLPDRDADRRSWHLALAAVGTDEGAAAALEQTGAGARERSAYAVAAEAFERAAELASTEGRQASLLFAAADSAWLAGRAERAVSLLGRAEDLGPDGDLRSATEHLRAHIATRQGPVMEGYGVLVDVAERLSAQDPDRAVAVLTEAVDAAFFAGDGYAMERAAWRARELASGSASTRTRFLSAIAEGMALVFRGEGEGGVESIRAAVALARETEELRDDPQLLPLLVMGPLWLREAGTGRELVEAAIERARARAALGLLPWLLTRIARYHAAADAWAAARIEYDESIRLARETGQRVDLAAALAGLAWLEALEGREQACRGHAGEALELCAAMGVAQSEAWAIRALGELELGLGRAEQAVEHFEALDDRLRSRGIADVDLSPAAELVEGYLRLGRTTDATRVAVRLAEQATAKGQPWSLARAERCNGLLAGEDGFERHFAEALRQHDRTPDLFESARTQLCFGARLRRERRRVRAREQLRIALETFETLGSRTWSAIAAAELEATGETARRRDVSTLDELTAHELQIAQLLASGKSTRESAAALFLSPKTIEYHRRSIYRKLGVKSRDELVDALALGA
jgi:DNA-binding CsgD family transcriptional regulator